MSTRFWDRESYKNIQRFAPPQRISYVDVEKNNEAIKFGIQKRQSEHEEKRAYAQQEKEYLEAANLMAREQERLRHLELQKTIGTWDTQVRTKEARDTWDLNDPDALKKTRLPRDPRPIWESRNQGSVSNAQTFACEYRDNPAWKGRVRSDYRSGLAYSMVDLHLKREAEAAEKQADEDLSRAQHQALTMMAAENERILKENRYQLARENQELSRTRQHHRAIEQRHERVVSAPTAPAPKPWEAGKGWGAPHPEPRPIHLRDRYLACTRQELGSIARTQAEQREWDRARAKAEQEAEMAWTRRHLDVQHRVRDLAVMEEATILAERNRYGQELRAQADQDRVRRHVDRWEASRTQRPATAGLLSSVGRTVRW